ncbi:MAG: flagellar motor switch protein FliN [Desulfobacterales bacterium]|nr:flagellar motor switch protein FliN [Desulfobacterales bacterium]
MEVEALDVEPPPGHGVHRIVGTLNMAGKVNGIFNVQATVDFGRLMAAGMLGMEPSEVDPASDVRDLLAEITNIVGGNLKSALNDAGHSCVLSTPSITYGTDFTIRSLNMDRYDRFVFGHAEHVFIVEVGLKAVEGADTGLDFSTPDAMSRIPNVDLEKLNAIDYQGRISGATRDVFDTMFSLQLDEATKVSAASLSGVRNVSSVCFAGDATGIVSIHVDLELSRRMAAGMLGMEPEELEGESEVQDMLGELGNIVGGNLKSALTDTGLRCALSTPSFTTGADFMIETLNLERYERFAFAMGEHTVFVEMGIKISELAKASTPAGKEVHYKVEAPAAAAPEVKPAALPRMPPPPKPAAAQPPPPPPPAPEAPPAPEDFGLDLLVDIPVELTVELGRSKIKIHELLKLQPGSTVKLARLEGEPVDILANDVLVARGEVVVRNEKYGIRITEITSRADRLKGLK